MVLKNSDRLRARLYAINMRVEELSRECDQAQVQVLHLESRLEDAQLARLVGEEAERPQAIRPELERWKHHLQEQQELLHTVKKSQQDARVALAVESLKERHQERTEQDTE